ncbi:MAG: hypothetical protein HY842_01320 [Bacteroidetes bacterium]|nr:hypothetical protein [Bacteroidota bacterium]
MALQQPNPLRILWKKLPAPLRNKYFLSITLFAGLLIFIDRHDLLTQWKLRGAVKRLEYDKAYYEQKIEEAKQDQQNIENNKEQFAREKYHMQKSDEDVFIIQDEK